MKGYSTITSIQYTLPGAPLVKDYPSLKHYTSIRPHAPIGEPDVTYIRVLRCVPGGTITSKLQHDDADL